MHIVAHGIDLVECSRIEALLSRHQERATDRLFTEAELTHANRHPRTRIERLAGRFAAKEAVLKLVGTGWRGPIAWTDIEVVNDALGRPVVNLSGEVRRIAEEQGITEISLSITHTANLAIASAVALTRSSDV